MVLYPFCKLIVAKTSREIEIFVARHNFIRTRSMLVFSGINFTLENEIMHQMDNV